MTRAMNPDGTPWWVSTGPPQPSNPEPSSPAVSDGKGEERQSSDSADGSSQSANSAPPFFGITPESQAAAFNAGLNLVTALLDAVSRPLTGEEAASEHDVSACGVCPLCVGVKALRDHDEDLADLVESAMAGVTSSAEKLTSMLPDLAEKLSEAVATNLVKFAFKNMSGK